MCALGEKTHTNAIVMVTDHNSTKDIYIILTKGSLCQKQAVITQSGFTCKVSKSPLHCNMC
jgi:hypothetical protein